MGRTGKSRAWENLTSAAPGQSGTLAGTPPLPTPCPLLQSQDEGSAGIRGDPTCVLTVLFVAVVGTVDLAITAPGQADAAA